MASAQNRWKFVLQTRYAAVYPGSEKEQLNSGYGHKEQNIISGLTC